MSCVCVCFVRGSGSKLVLLSELVSVNLHFVWCGAVWRGCTDAACSTNLVCICALLGVLCVSVA